MIRFDVNSVSYLRGGYYISITNSHSCCSSSHVYEVNLVNGMDSLAAADAVPPFLFLR